MSLRALVATAALALLLATAAPADDLLEVEVTRDLAYVEGEDVTDRQRLDLYVPRGEGPWPVLMWIHGGAWAVGHRKQEEALARRFAERGFAVAAIDHRMSKALWISEKLDTGVQHPEHVKDCAAAFAWLRKEAPARGLDRERMFVGGFSSGAHLSALLATDRRYLKAHGIGLDEVKGSLPVGGAYDIRAYYEAHLEANGERMAELHVLDVFGRKEGALEDASPLTHVAESKVPMLVISEKDTYGYTKLFEDALAGRGMDHIRFLHLLDRGHKTIGKQMAREGPDEARDAMIAFMEHPAGTQVSSPPPETVEDDGSGD